MVDLNAALQKRGVETKGLKLKKDLVAALVKVLQSDSAPPPPPPVDPSKLRVVDLNAGLQKRGVETKDLKLKKGLVPALESGGDHARA